MSRDIEEQNVELIFTNSEVEDYVAHDKHHKPKPNKNEFTLKACEELKEVCIDDVMKDTVKIVKVKAKIDKLCPNRKLAIAIQLIDVTTNEIISQKGRTIETGCSAKCNNTAYENFIFALPGFLCKNEGRIKAVIYANYILDYEYTECEHCFCDK